MKKARALNHDAYSKMKLCLDQYLTVRAYHGHEHFSQYPNSRATCWILSYWVSNRGDFRSEPGRRQSQPRQSMGYSVNGASREHKPLKAKTLPAPLLVDSGSAQAPGRFLRG